MIPPKHAADLAAYAHKAQGKNWQELLREHLLSARRHVGLDMGSSDKSMTVVTETINGIPTIVSIDEASDITEEMIEEILGHKPHATEVKQGVTLFTKDGSHTGNAIVVEKVGQTRDWSPLDPATGERTETRLVDVWLVETDFGNQMKLTIREIYTLFNLGRQSTYTRWFDDRLELIAKRTAEL